MLSLTVEKGEPAGAVFELKPGESTLGRSHSATFRLLSQDVSGLHIRIRVANGVASLENLGQFGTRVNEAPVAGAVTLASGQRIGVGKVTVLLFKQTDGDDAPTGGGEGRPAAEAKPRAAEKVSDTARTKQEGLTGVLPADAATRAVSEVGATRAVAAQGAADASELTSALSRPSYGQEEGATEGATRAMQTRAASPEEIDLLRQSEQKRLRRRTTIGLSVLVPVVILTLIFRPRTPPPENEIEWTLDANGDFVDAVEPGPSGGSKDGGYNFCYPGNNTFKKKTIEGGVVLEGWIARNLDVPMRILVQESKETRFVTMSRAEFVQDWIQQASASGGSWNFDKPSPSTSFFGKRNGVPFTRVTYLRDGDGSWFGVASVVRDGARRIVVRAEVPAAERVRAERMLSDNLLHPSDEFEYSYWEGVLAGAKLAEDEVLTQVRADIERMAPATWVAIGGLLNSLLTQSVLNGHKETEAEALRLLIKLRERQTLWFNSQKLAFNAARMQNNLQKAAKTAEFTKAVFSDMEDQRYFDVRKWKVEP